MRRNQLQRQALGMMDQLVKLGYSPETIQDYLEDKKGKQRSNMHRAIVSYFYKGNYDCMQKAFNHLKAYVARKKALKLRAIQVFNWMNHPLALAFRKWKYDMADTEEKLKGLSKQQIIDKIIADENLIGSTKSRLARMGDSINMLAFQRDNLYDHYMRGQKLAIALCKNNALKSIFRAFNHWKRVYQESESMKLIEQLERTQAMISDLQNHVGKLENINKRLLGENEELRQAALDGIEISNTV